MGADTGSSFLFRPLLFASKTLANRVGRAGGQGREFSTAGRMSLTHVDNFLAEGDREWKRGKNKNLFSPSHTINYPGKVTCGWEAVRFGYSTVGFLPWTTMHPHLIWWGNQRERKEEQKNETGEKKKTSQTDNESSSFSSSSFLVLGAWDHHLPC